MTQTDSQRDKAVTMAVHRLFWQAMFTKRAMLALTYLCHLPSFFIFNVLIPLQVAYGIQEILTRDFGAVHHQAIVVLLTTAFGAAIFAVGTWANHRVNVDGAAYVQRAVFSNYLGKDYDFYGSRYIGALGADAVSLRIAFQEYSLLATFDIPKSLVIIFVGLGVIIYKSPTLGLISSACVLAVLFVSVFIAKLRLKYRRDVSQASSRLAGMIGDPLSHGPAVKSFAQEDFELDRLKQPLGVWQRAQLKIFDTSIPHHFIRHVMLGLTMGILLVASARLYQHNAISIALVALVQLYIIRVVNTTIEIGEIVKQYETLMSATYEPMATMLVPTTVNDSKQTLSVVRNGAHKITFKDVVYRYPEAAKGLHAINQFSLEVQPGEKIGLVGYSGGGKTTITKLLLRFLDVTDGRIEIDGIDIRKLSQAELRQAIAYVPQEPLLFHRSIKENIAYAKPAAAMSEILTAAQTAYADEFIRELPAGYDAMVGERGIKLSGGQRQRVAIARALLMAAPILVLDEATSSLDSQSEKYIQKALWELMKDKTAIVIAHRLSTIQHMDRIVVLDKGRIAQIGNHQQLLKDTHGVYAKLWAHQSDGYIIEAPD